MEKNDIRVLIVDDNPADVRLIIEMLKESQSFSFKASHADRIDKTLQMLEDKDFDIVLLDLNLPDSNGLAGLERIIAKTVQIPVILLTGIDSEKIGIQALQKNASDYLVKGQINSATLVRTIRYAIERKRSEAALRDSEERFRSLIENADEVVAIVEINGRIRYISPNVGTIFGFPQNETVGKDSFGLIHPEDVAKCRNEFEDIVRKPRELHDIEARVRHRDGSWRWSHIAGKNLLAEPAVNGIVLNIRDITERKNSELALRESEEKYRALVKHAPSAIYEMDLQGTRFLDVNQVMCDILGYSREELLAIKPTELLDPESRLLFRERIKKKLAGAKINDEVEYRIRRKDGEWIYTAINVGAVTYTKEEPSRVVVVAYDVTERKRAQKELQESRAAALSLMEDAVEARERSERDRDALRESEARLKLAQSSAGAGLWDWDMVTGKLQWSQELFRLFGLETGTVDATFGAWESVIHPEDRQIAQKRIEISIEKRRPLDSEYRIVRAHGEVRWIESLGNTTYDKHNKPQRMAGICIDITDRKKAEDDLRRLNRTLTALSHSNEELMRVSDESTYLASICRVLVKDCDYKMAWIGFAENDKAQTVRPVAQAGFEKDYLKTVNITWADTVQGRGPTGMCIRTGKPVICRDMLVDPAFTPWRAEALKRGYASSMALPLIMDGKPFGSVTLYSAFPDPFTDEEIKLLVQLSEDISYGITALRWRAAQVKAESETKKAHLKTKGILESITEAYIVFDRQGRFVELNRCAEELLGKRIEVLKGRTFKDVFPKVKETEFYRRFRKALAYNKDMHFEAFSAIAGKWFETHAYPFPEGIAVYLHDISQRKAIEEALRETKDYLDSLINHANAPIIVWDPDFKIVRFNHAFEFISGYESAEMIGKELEILFPDDSKNDSIAKIEQTLIGEHWESADIPIRCKNGDIRTLLWNSANIYRQDNKRLAATIAQGQDITGRKLAEELLVKSRDELEQRVVQRTADLIKAQKQLMAAKRLSDIGALSATVAHELRNPLGVIRAAAFNVRRKNRNQDLEKHLDRIDKKVLESDQIINNLLFYSRLRVPHFEKIRLLDIIKEAVADSKVKYKGSCVVVRTSFAALTHIMIEADPAQIRELCSNILNNAYEAFDGKKGLIEVKGSFDVSDGVTKISFIDNGCGIPNEIIHKIQEPFFTTKSQGTGLGLAVCYQVARLHGGNIEVTSTEGKGSVFSIILPAKRDQERVGE